MRRADSSIRASARAPLRTSSTTISGVESPPRRSTPASIAFWYRSFTLSPSTPQGIPVVMPVSEFTTPV
jgi:hypothetical protein